MCGVPLRHRHPGRALLGPAMLGKQTTLGLTIPGQGLSRCRSRPAQQMLPSLENQLAKMMGLQMRWKLSLRERSGCETSYE